jgi:hypothetical protein
LKVKRKIDSFQDKHKLKQFMITAPALQKILEVILHREEGEKRYMQAQELRKE